ncbi:ABC transporter substrate-binding protein [Ideonella livida]|uniref:ABC transporter substrate-binding protein n=1 Tax=Ideonella livida TaxID=2707176 RepID=A0A7C9PG03_9BURK|nr:ABC transporter substrate-binding protein [Ideonella livida]NDY90134.1 ABC transporter substrate-binding protein [Ideonella livida]
MRSPFPSSRRLCGAAVALLVAAATLLGGPALAQPAKPAASTAGPLIIANFGGANGAAQELAFVRPFAQRSGLPLKVVETTGELAPIRRMVKGELPRWDVVEVESTDLAQGCAEGLFEPIERPQLTHGAMMLPGTLRDCGVGAFVWSTVLAFDSARLKNAPTSWADFFDVTRFPGKRALRKGARYTLEIALLADGVPRRDVYKVLATQTGQTRALQKLDTLRPHLVWWESGAQPAQWLASGEVVMSSAFNGRIAAARKQPGGASLQSVWNDAIYEFDYWAIVKGSPRKAEALAYINHATSPDAQLAFAAAIPYGPTHLQAIMKHGERPRTAAAVDPHGSLVDLSMVASDLPSDPANLRRAVAFSADFWLQHGPALEPRVAGTAR